METWEFDWKKQVGGTRRRRYIWWRLWTRFEGAWFLVGSVQAERFPGTTLYCLLYSLPAQPEFKEHAAPPTLDACCDALVSWFKANAAIFVESWRALKHP